MESKSWVQVVVTQCAFYLQQERKLQAVISKVVAPLRGENQVYFIFGEACIFKRWSVYFNLTFHDKIPQDQKFPLPPSPRSLPLPTLPKRGILSLHIREIYLYAESLERYYRHTTHVTIMMLSLVLGQTYYYFILLKIKQRVNFWCFWCRLCRCHSFCGRVWTSSESVLELFSAI